MPRPNCKPVEVETSRRRDVVARWSAELLRLIAPPRYGHLALCGSATEFVDFRALDALASPMPLHNRHHA